MGSKTGTLKNRFDFEFIPGTNTDNSVLWLKLTLCLQQVPGSSSPAVAANGKKFDIQDWKTSEWQAYKLFVGSAGAFWDKNFILIPPTSASDFTYKTREGTVWMPNVECRFRLTIQETP